VIEILASERPESEFDADEYVLTTSGSRSVRVELFEQVRIRIRDELDKSSGKRKVRMELI